jgi:hypothetical protein
MKIQRGPARVIKTHHSKIRAVHRQLLASRWRWFALIATISVVGIGTPFPSAAAGCSVSSSQQRVALLELYTSEGCNSCPPADRWLSGLRARGVRDDQLVALAFHVDYWDYIGWKDRFAKPGFASRQRVIADRNQASFIYTPQFVLNGRDFQRPWLGDKLAKRLGLINAERSKIDINADLTALGESMSISVHVRNNDTHEAHVYVAMFENGLSTEVRAGENAGKRLYHEYVVRRFEGPLVVAPSADGSQQFHFDLTAFGDRSHLGFAVFSEDGASGATMQAMALPFCPEP